MTAETRFDRDLPVILEDLYLGPSPDYRNEVMAAAVRTRQRPSWTFAGRWFPMADIASRSAFAPRVPWRTIGMAVLIVALALAAVALVVGSRQTKVPPPFGPAANGLITYSADGDIYTVDPTSGLATAIVTGPTADSEPVFSHDGRRVAFRRQSTTSASPADDIVVVNADGSHPVVVNAQPFPGGSGGFEWAPDSRSLIVNATARGSVGSATFGTQADGSAVWLFDADAVTAPRALAVDGASAYLAAARPPDGKAILINRPIGDDQQLLVLDVTTGKETLLATGGAGDIGQARWSPDGSRVVYSAKPADDLESERLFIVNADGTGARQITSAPGTWFDIDMAWSPDGSQIAFLRYERVGEDDWRIRPIGIYSVADGSVRDVGPLAAEVRSQAPNPADQYATTGEGMFIDWSPDGAMILAYPSEATGHPVLIDPVDGTWTIVPQLTTPKEPSQAWQRLAP
ncbi:MAG TPA: hypothetical protein VIZ22_10650 [Candidatus Limnocylindrales bacterium]